MTTREIYPWGMFEMDESTGLPTLIEGHFWRVSKSVGGYWRVSLMKRRRGWFSKNVSWTSFSPSEFKDNRSEILKSAGYLMYKREYERPIDTSLLGDYPPKSLTHQPTEQEQER